MVTAAQRANAMRIATFVTLGLAVALGAWKFSRVDGNNRNRPELQSGEISVREAVGRLKPVTIRGYLFNDVPNGFRLCDARDPGDPPKCIGPFVTLGGGFDGNRFNLKTGKDKDGFTVVWAKETVVVSGTLDGLFMKVDQVLN